ncbi:LysM peptidoglycan-binding domain-containing protein [Cohaesibacter haloalkalitolerans]|uniref:LysM peptidoglycan-binding domain-containing protein n=1 Tax=Cohaesibacter haloalkalitolerans TaxID=1162980 RepID=UPI000E64EEC6|nr:LysM peptidoglycan-binding domain-containing protein [Cohaesibacter haloalkalitolerans]
MKSAAPFVAIVCGVIVAVVVGIGVFGDRIGLGGASDGIKKGLAPVTSLVAPSGQKAEEPAADKPATTEATKTEAEAAAPADDAAPTFDIVRVEPNGNTLVAGRAQPGWTVELKNGEATLSKAVADVNGEWVMVLSDPLGAGVSDLSLSAKAKDGDEAVASASSVTVSRSEDGSGDLLVVETAPGQASKVLASVAKSNESAAPEKSASEAPAPAAGQTEVASVTTPEAAAPAVSAEKPAATQEPATPSAESQQASVSTDTPEAAPAAPATTAPAAPAVDAAPSVAAVAGQTVAIEAVEIEGDTLFVAGAAEPAGSILRLYIDNGEVANSKSGETGRFLFDNKVDLKDGSHVARVDMLNGANGQVLTRAEVSFSKQPGLILNVTAQGSLGDKYQHGVSASAESGSVETKKVIIRRGDNLWTIARRVYGAGIRYSTIYDTNSDQIRDPHWIYPGQVFELPHGQDGWDNNFDAVEEPDQKTAPVEAPAPTPAAG